MTNKDLFKILLCSYGYDRNIKIETFRTDNGTVGYEIEAENEKGDVFHNVDGEGVMFDIFVILDYMKQNNVVHKSKWSGIPLKYMLNDAEREKLVNQWDALEAQIRKDIERMTPLWKWREENNPCPTCTINKKDHWDSIHYNCELCHTHSCSILLDFGKKYDDKKQEYLKTESHE